MSSGGDQTTEVRINPLMRQGGQLLQGDATNFYNQGTSGIYQGSRLADFNPLIAQGEQQMLDYWGGTGQQNFNNANQTYNQLLRAGDYDNPFLREQIAGIVEGAGSDFRRSVAPRLDQQATGAGQFGSSRAGVAEGIALGDMQNTIGDATINALLGGQQLSAQALGMTPMMQAAGAMPGQAISGIGSARTARDQARLMDEIQMFEAPRNAQLLNMQQYSQLMNSNPLMGEQTQITQGPDSDPWAQALGLGLTGASMFMGNPGAFSSLFGGGGTFSQVPSTGIPGLNYAVPFSGGSNL